MIYFIVFIYLLVCVIIYDVYESRSHSKINYIILFTLFTLIAGLRWRLGVDTVKYMTFFQYDMVSLSQLSVANIIESQFQPFWILLNAFCKSCDSFTLLQIFVSTFFHISVFYFLHKACTKPFTALTIYYLYNYFYFSMEIMRESLAVACFLFGIICLNKGNMTKYYIWATCAFLFHFFAIFLFFIPPIFLQKKIISIKRISIFFLLLVIWFFFKIQILMCIVNISPPFIKEHLIGYFIVDRYASNAWRITGFIYHLFPLLIISTFFYIHFCKKCKNLFKIKEHIWVGATLLYFLFLILSTDMAIILRFSNYMYFIISILYASCLYIIPFNKISKSIFILTCFVLMFSLRVYILARPERIFADYKLKIHMYAEFYPYTSVFNKNEPLERKILHTYWGDIYWEGRK